jgi:hypothetical protein
MLPYDKLFVDGKGKFVQGVVKSFLPNKDGGGGTVTLESGETIECAFFLSFFYLLFILNFIFFLFLIQVIISSSLLKGQHGLGLPRSHEKIKQ